MDAGMTKDSIGMGQLSLSGSVALLPAGTKVLVLAIGSLALGLVQGTGLER